MLRRPSPAKRRKTPAPKFLIYTLKIRNRRKPHRIINLHFSNLYKTGPFFIMLCSEPPASSNRQNGELEPNLTRRFSTTSIFLIAKNRHFVRHNFTTFLSDASALRRGRRAVRMWGR